MAQWKVETGALDPKISSHYEVMYLANNANGEIVSTTNPLPVSFTSGSGGTGSVNIDNLPEVSVTAFEEPLSVSITPVIQQDAVYGLDPDIWRKSELRGGSITTANSTWRVSSGTSAGGYARLATANYVRYQPGQGSMFRWTAAFTANGTTRDAYGVDNIVQNTGPIDREDGYSIGYSGSTANNASRKIGILHRKGGKAELRQLTITTAPTGTQTATITLDGVPYTATINASSNTVFTTHEIAAKLRANTTASNTWDIEACDSTITFTYYSPGAKNGTYSFSSTGTGTLAVGNFTTIQSGATPVDEWIYVDDWNGNKPNFDPTKLNVFGMDFRWLGAGRVRFFMEDPATGKMVLIHTHKTASSSLTPHIINPSLRVIYRAGTTNPAITPSQDVVITGSSVFGGIQGNITQTTLSQSYYNTVTGNRAADTIHHLLSIQNPFVRNNGVNKSNLIIQNLTVSAQGNDPSVIFIVKNAIGTSGYLLFNPLPVQNAFDFAQYSTTVVSEDLTRDVINNIQTLAVNGSSQFDLLPYNITLAAGEYISVFLISTSVITRTAAGISWRVD